MSLQILQNSQESTSARVSFLIKLGAFAMYKPGNWFAVLANNRVAWFEIICTISRSVTFSKVAGAKVLASTANQWTGFYMIEAYNFIKTETLAQVFSGEFCEISKNTFFYRTPPVAASVFVKVTSVKCGDEFWNNRLSQGVY